VTLLPASGLGDGDPEPTRSVAARVASAWRVQRTRQSRANAHLRVGELGATHGFDAGILRHLDHRSRQMALSLRRVHRAARVARTIADLEGAELVRHEHVDEALRYRPLAVAA
jgi:magnesium chelatase family protein